MSPHKVERNPTSPCRRRILPEVLSPSLINTRVPNAFRRCTQGPMHYNQINIFTDSVLQWKRKPPA